MTVKSEFLNEFNSTLDSRKFCRSILHSQSFEGSHTGEQMQRKLKEMLTKWGAQDCQVHLVFRGNGANMVKALNDAGLSHYSCLHTLCS